MSNLVPEGYYDAVCVPGPEKVQFGYSSKDNEQVLVTLQILNGPHAGVRVPWFGYFTKDAGKRTTESLRYLGFKGSDLNDINKQPLDQKVQIDVEHNTYEEKTHARVAWINKIGSGIKLSKPMDATQLRGFAAKLNARIKSIPEHEGEKAEAGAATNGAASKPEEAKPEPAKSDDGWGQGGEAPPPKDDDIPF